MPLYDYACPTHGEFREWRSMSESELDAACPACGAPAPRQVAKPFLPRVARNVRIAHERNERSAEEPKVMRREELLAAHGRLGAHGHHHHGQQRAGRNMYRRTMLGHGH
jgi:putative FmdB family regulatory protein